MPPPELTQLLADVNNGVESAEKQLLQAVYGELKRVAAAKMSREAPGQTLQATALVHDAWHRLHRNDGQMPAWDSRSHFFSAAAEAMRRILIENARRKRALKNGGGIVRTELSAVELIANNPDEELLLVSEALEAFEALAPTKAQLVKFRYFIGLTMKEAADLLGISLATAKRHWVFSRAWLANHIRRSSKGEI